MASLIRTCLQTDPLESDEDIEDEDDDDDDGKEKKVKKEAKKAGPKKKIKGSRSKKPGEKSILFTPLI